MRATLLLNAVTTLGILARANPSPENVEVFRIVKREFNAECRALKYEALAIHAAKAKAFLADPKSVATLPEWDKVVDAVKLAKWDAWDKKHPGFAYQEGVSEKLEID